MHRGSILLTLLALLAPLPPARAQEAVPVAEAARRILSESRYRYEIEFPEPEASRPPRPPPAVDEDGGSFLDLGRGARTATGAALWISAGVALLAVLVWILGAKRRGRGTPRPVDARSRARPAAVPPQVPTGAPAPAPAGDPLADALAAARRGDFADAVHRLLQAAFAWIGRREPLRPSATSREVARGLARPAGPARADLEVLVRAVEASRFAGRPVDAAGFDAALTACRAVLAGGTEGAR